MTTTIDYKNPDITTVDSFSSFAVGSALSTLNFLDQTIYNQWYTAVSGSNTVLISNFIYTVTSTSTAGTTESAITTTMVGMNWDVTGTGDKLCYASTITTGNVPF